MSGLRLEPRHTVKETLPSVQRQPLVQETQQRHSLELVADRALVPLQPCTEYARPKIGQRLQGPAAELLDEEAHHHRPLQERASAQLGGGLELDQIQQRQTFIRALLGVCRQGLGEGRVHVLRGPGGAVALEHLVQQRPRLLGIQ
jgi:hypothetical protein